MQKSLFLIDKTMPKQITHPLLHDNFLLVTLKEQCMNF